MKRRYKQVTSNVTKQTIDKHIEAMMNDDYVTSLNDVDEAYVDMTDKQLLEAVKLYIEGTELQYDDEYGIARTLEELKNDGAMPKIYTEICKRLENL